MSSRKIVSFRLPGALRGEPLSAAERLMLGVSALALAGAVMALVRIFS
jgi:hypothetical protein